MITRDFNQKMQLLRVVRKGVITCNDILEHIQAIANDAEQLPPNLKILTYASESTLNFNMKDQNLFVDEIRKHLSKFNSVRQAIIFDHPRDFAFSLMFEKMTEVLSSYTYRSFSTEEAALKWLLV